MRDVRPDVDIIVVTYNSARVIGDLLDSLPDALGEIASSITVVDNGSTDETVQILLERGDCQVVRSTNVGYAGGINRGVKEGSGANAILILNPDTRLAPRSVAPLLKALGDPTIGIVVPRLLSGEGQPQFSLRRTPTLLRALGLGSTTGHPALSEHVQEASAYEHPHSVDWATGAVLMISKTCFEALGGWDESYFLYSEETDFCLRAKDIGLLTWFVPESVVFHIGGGSGRSNQTQTMCAVNRVRLYRRRHGILASWCYYALTFASEFYWGLRGYPRARFAAMALLRPSLRPQEIRCSDHLLPR